VKNRVKGCLFAIVVLFVCGCGLIAPVAESVQSVGITAGDRQALLPNELTKFNTALFWGRAPDALAYVLPESRESVQAQLRKGRDQERLVESKVDNIDYSEDGYDATVEVTFKYFKVPFYIVTERHEVQKWRFTIRNGWKLLSREIQT